MPNNIEIKANSKDAVLYAVLTQVFGLTVSVCLLIAFATLFPKFVRNQDSYATRMNEFNAAVGKCLVLQQEKYGRRDAPSCRRYVNSYLNFYEHH